MIDLSYASALFISYAGILVGITLSIVSPEERKPLRKYFLMMKLIVPWLLIIASIYFSVGNWISFVFLGLFALYLLSGKSSGKITYIFLGALFFIASESPDFLVTASTIIFLFGIPAGALYSSKRKGLMNLKILAGNSGFIAAGLILPLVFLYL
ncbi:MAG TPA: hypothetical protein VJI46_07300 [Candidatus Nanoarchaeia archaeon]|nr:hypothetical protein [Candidatus Nanoarchaeia archaeon]